MGLVRALPHTILGLSSRTRNAERISEKRPRV